MCLTTDAYTVVAFERVFPTGAQIGALIEGVVQKQEGDVEFVVETPAVYTTSAGFIQMSRDLRKRLRLRPSSDGPNWFVLTRQYVELIVVSHIGCTCTASGADDMMAQFAAQLRSAYRDCLDAERFPELDMRQFSKQR